MAKRALSKRMQIKDEKELEDTYQLAEELYPGETLSDPRRIQNIFEDLAKRVPAAKTANAKEYVDMRFIEELDKSGYIDATVSAV